MNGGNVTVLGPTSDGDTALDFDGTFTINGGVLMAFGSSGMLETPTSAQNGCCIVTTLGTVSANSAFSLMDSSGNMIMSYTPTKNYASAIVYSSDIKNGSTYTVTAGSTTQSITVNSNGYNKRSQRRLRRWSEWRFWRRTAWRTAWRQCT